MKILSDFGSCDGTTSSDLTCWFRVSATGGRAATSLPHCELNRVGPDVYEAFMDGVRTGMAEYAQVVGFGALGEYESRHE